MHSAGKVNSCGVGGQLKRCKKGLHEIKVLSRKKSFVTTLDITSRVVLAVSIALQRALTVLHNLITVN